MLTSLKSKHNVGLLYILPWVIGFLAFQLYPLASSFIYSFTDMSMSDSTAFIGFDNYVYMFTKDTDFYQSLKVTILYALMAVPGRVIFALVVAVVLSAKLRGINFYRVAFYLPSIFGGSIAISIIWRFLFQKEGTVNGILGYFSIPSVEWLGNPAIVLLTIAFIPIWQFGSSMVLFLAAIKQVPKDLYEASKLDGASRFRSFMNITLPMISPIMLFNLVMQSIACMQEFTSAFVLTSGGPNKATYVFAIKLYEEGFSFFKMGYASALSWILFILIMLFTLVIFKSSKYWAYYEDGGK
jgi:oligogalacturonide transport system permease protein